MSETDCFLTGSRRYGVPHDGSDTDVVIGCTSELAALLWKESEAEGKCVFGKLNLIIFCTDTSKGLDDFARWRAVTDELAARAPVSRDEAVLAFQAVGFGNERTSG